MGLREHVWREERLRDVFASSPEIVLTVVVIKQIFPRSSCHHGIHDVVVLLTCCPVRGALLVDERFHHRRLEEETTQVLIRGLSESSRRKCHVFVAVVILAAHILILLVTSLGYLKYRSESAPLRRLSQEILLLRIQIPR